MAAQVTYKVLSLRCPNGGTLQRETYEDAGQAVTSYVDKAMDAYANEGNPDHVVFVVLISYLDGKQLTRISTGTVECEHEKVS